LLIDELRRRIAVHEAGHGIVFHSPPLWVQSALFSALAPVAYWRGYSATCPQLSRIVLTPRV
jgi:hypothetical protein